MRIFLDHLPGHDAADLRAATRAGATLVRDRERAWFVVGSPREIRDAPEGAPLWLRGAEAAGEGGPFGALTLIRAAARSGRPWVVEGLGLAASAAALAVGAAGVVLDAATWTTRGSPLDPATREALLRARGGRDTEVVAGRRQLRGHPLAAPQSVAEARRGDGLDLPELIARTRSDLADRLARIATSHAVRPGLDPLGCGRPVVQGPMANVTEGPGLAVAVSASGALPFCALGALDPARAREVLAGFDEALRGRRWGAGIIGFDVMPHRDAHLDAVAALGDRAPVVILAGGTAATARALAERGVQVWLHTPSATLARQALERGVPAVVFEGREAGGHVGALTSVGLWEEGLAAVAERSDHPLAVLAGGIGDPVTAAFAAAMGADAVAAGARVALQAGTAFLATHEIVESGQITPLYQQVALSCDHTVLVGDSVGLPLRCAPNAFTRDAVAAEAGWRDEGLPLTERRLRVEHHNLGRTRLAARGIERNPTWPDHGPRYRTAPAARQLAEGAYSLGEGAALADRAVPVREVVEALSVGAAAWLDRVAGEPIGGHPLAWPAPTAVHGRPASRGAAVSTSVRLGAHPAPTRADVPIAIVGLGCVLPGAPDIARFWANLVEGVDAIGPIPDDRWPAWRYWDPTATSTGPVRSVSRRAGVVGRVSLDPGQFRIPPKALPTVDPAQRLALLASDQAVRDAGWDRPGFDRSRAAVILGNAMGGEHAKSLALRIRFAEVLAALEAEGGLDGLEPAQRDALFARVESRLDAALPPVEVDSMAGLLGNVVAGRVASWLDWMGGSFTVDAACAASLASLAVAVDWLRNHRCDAVLAGGVDADLSPETFSGFTRTLALSAEGSAPFSARADGFVMGEGAAVFALRRLPDALAAGEPVWAVIRAVGQASDGRGRSLTAPRAEGQRLAVQRAWSEAGVEADAFELIEAHGTGTAVGDATEVGVLAGLLGEGEAPVWLGSVKASIGHLKGGAGAAGLLKATLALATGVAPPTLHAAPIAPIAGLTGGRLRLPRRPVRLRGGLAGVSAFGFGGTDFHAVLAPPDLAHPKAGALLAVAEPLVAAPDDAGWRDTPPPPLLLAFAGADEPALHAAVRDDRPTSPELAAAAPWRCAVLVDPETRVATLDRVTRWLEAGAPTGRLARVAFVGRGPAEPVVVLVPGQGASPRRARHVVERVPVAARVLGALAPPPADPAALDPLSVHRALVPVAIAWSALLGAAKLPVAATLGHSLGELGALVAAGRLDRDAAVAVAEARGAALAACPEGAMIAVALPADAAVALAKRVGAELAAENAMDRCVLAGAPAAIARAEAELAAEGVPCRRLAVTRAYHAAPTAPAAALLADRLVGVPFPDGVPCWSGATAAPMTDPAADLTRGLVSPVRFAAAVTGLLDAGHRTFVELGPGESLTAFVRSIAPGATVVPLDPEPGDHGAGLAAAAAALVAAGHAGLVSCLPATCLVVGLPSATPAPPRRPRVPGATGDWPSGPPSPSPRPDAAATPVDASNAVLEVPPPDATPAPEDPVLAAVLDAVCHVTGYPRTFVDGGAELEAELGVDSIRKLEILGRIEDQLGFRATEADHRLLERASVDGLVAFARERLAAPPAALRPRPARGVTLWTRVPTGPEGAHRAEPALLAGDHNWVGSPLPGHVAARVRAAVAQAVDAARTEPRPLGLEVRGAPDDPATTALVGFARSLGREWDVPVDVEPREASWLPHRPEAEGAPHSPAIWVTGGLGGLLAPTLAACADLDPRVTVLGRSPHHEALARLRSLGIAIDHLACDLADPDTVARVVADRLASHGPPALVIHGAAATADGPIGGATAAAIERVLGPKVDGLAHLVAALPESTRWLLLSSVAAVEGNAGQALYAAANGALHGWRLPHATTVASTAWRGVGLAASSLVLRELERRGVVPVDPEVAAGAMRELIAARLTDRSPREALLVGQDPPGARPLAWPLHAVADVTADRLVARIRVSPADPELHDHRVAGRALVPAALWIRAIDRAHALVAPDAVVARVTDLHLDLPTRVDAVRDDLFVDLARVGRRWAATLRVGQTVVGGAQVAAAVLPKGRRAPPRPLAGQPPPYRPDALFHGPRWQVVVRWSVDGDRAEADLRLGPEPVADLVDGAHQVLALWAYERLGAYALPVGAASWSLVDVAVTAARVAWRATVAPTGVVGELSVFAPDGQLLASASGVLAETGAVAPMRADA